MKVNLDELERENNSIAIPIPFDKVKHLIIELRAARNVIQKVRAFNLLEIGVSALREALHEYDAAMQRKGE